MNAKIRGHREIIIIKKNMKITRSFHSILTKQVSDISIFILHFDLGFRLVKVINNDSNVNLRLDLKIVSIHVYYTIITENKRV